MYLLNNEKVPYNSVEIITEMEANLCPCSNEWHIPFVFISYSYLSSLSNEFYKCHSNVSISIHSICLTIVWSPILVPGSHKNDAFYPVLTIEAIESFIVFIIACPWGWVSICVELTIATCAVNIVTCWGVNLPFRLTIATYSISQEICTRFLLCCALL